TRWRTPLPRTTCRLATRCSKAAAISRWCCVDSASGRVRRGVRSPASRPRTSPRPAAAHRPRWSARPEVGLEVPDWARQMFQVVVGESWPQADEDLLRQLAQEWTTFATVLAEAEAAVQGASQSLAGDGWEGMAAETIRGKLKE